MLAVAAPAQWLNLREAKPNLSAPAPRAANGKPDLSGVWHHGDASPYTGNIFHDLKPDENPERPEGARVRGERMKSGVRDNPSVHCLPHGIPLNNLLGEVVKIIQAADLILVIHETDSTYRQIYTDGRNWKQMRSRRGWVTRRVNGKATRSWWRQPASMTNRGWISWATRIARRCV
jgi:hypothetical protein